MDRFEAMRTLVAAIDGGSLSAASRALNVPLPTVSRRVSDLEAMLKAQLVVRTSRKLSLTEAGTAYLALARRVLEDLGEAERTASGEYCAPRGELVVTAPILFGQLNVAPIIYEFLHAYPEVCVRFVLSDNSIDLVGHHIDVAIRIGPLPDSALVARKVGEVRWVVCASPEYLSRCGEPSEVAELPEHACIAFEEFQRYRVWPFTDASDAACLIAIDARFSTNTAEGVTGAAAAGLGIARVLSYQAANSVREGTLVQILAAFAGQHMPVHLVHAAHQQQPAKLRAFLDFIAPRLHQRLRSIESTFDSKGPETV